MGFFERANSSFNTSPFMENQLNSTNVELNCLLCSKHCIVGNIREEQDKEGPYPQGTLSSWEDEK